MKNMMATIERKAILAQFRIKEALQNDDGMEIIQFLGVALVSITLAALLVTGLSGSLQTTIEAAKTKINGLLNFS